MMPALAQVSAGHAAGSGTNVQAWLFANAQAWVVVALYYDCITDEEIAGYQARTRWYRLAAQHEMAQEQMR